MKKQLKLLLLILIGVIAFTLAGCSHKESVTELNSTDAKIAVEPGTPLEDTVDMYYPQAQKIYVNSASDGVVNLLKNKTDAFITDNVTAQKVYDLNSDELSVTDNDFDIKGNVVIGVAKDSKINNALGQINEFLEEVKNNGILDDMYNRWIINEDYTMPDIPEAVNPSCTITVGTTGLLEPYTFYQNNKVTGFDIELARRYANWLNASIVIETYDWNGIFSAIATSRIDYMFSGIYERPELNKTIEQSEPYRVVVPTVLVRNENGANGSFISRFKKNMYKNFIEDMRWKLLLDGLVLTLEITVLSVFFGLILGFIICLGKRSRYKWLKNTLNVITQLLKGVPILVLLLILYYVVFTNMTNIVTVVIAFSINFAAYISDTMVGSIAIIDKGQWEAAAMLGFSKKRTFIHIILPQVLKQFLPALLGSAISLMHMTSLVGYISVVDITYASQLIRARTYNALYPLIATAVAYIIFSALLVLIMRLIQHSLFENRKPLKGINTDIEISDVLKDIKESSQNDNETIIKVRGLTKEYPNITPLKNLDCDIKRGEVISIIGPSGTGKSTLMRCITRLEDPTEGSIELFGKEIAKEKQSKLTDVRQKTGMVFQSFNLFPHLTVIENIMIAPVLIKKVTRQEAYETGMSLLSKVGLADKALNYPDELSGGQKQRVAIARTLAMKPEIIFFDEPTSALDPNTVGEVLIVINQLAGMGLTMMIVTHEMKFARSVATRVFYMDKGVVYENGTPDKIYDNPETELCRRFVHNLKVCRLEFEKDKINLPDIVRNITEFGHKYFITEEQIVKMYQISEELCIILLSQNKEFYNIVMETEYDSAKKECISTIKYAGEKKNVIEDEENLSIKLVASKTKNMEYEYSDNMNIIKIIF